MSLIVQTARISYRGEGRLDITRKSGTVGLFLAPSWEILRPALEARAEAVELLRRAGAAQYDPREAPGDAARIEAEAWDKYRPAFLAEMRRSYVEKRGRWDWLLAQERVVLVCYCVDATHCHRAILRADILPKLGATDGGEVAA